MTGPAPYELRLSERPGDRAMFDSTVEGLIWRSRPGHVYRAPWWSGPARRRQARADWERIVRSLAGYAYELGRQP